MHVNTRTYILCLLNISLCIICSCTWEKTSHNADFRKQLEDLILNFHLRGEFDGVILVGDTNEVIFQEAYGFSNRDGRIPLQIESQFYLASVSKQFTASAILLLLQQGKVSLDQEIVKYLPELPVIYRSITFRHLLNHTSGIPDYYNFTEPWDGFTNADVLRKLISIHHLEFEPGARYTYSNSGYVLLSILVSRISEMRFAEFLMLNALDKAGLKETIVFDEYADEPHYRVKGYGPDSTLTDYTYRTTGGGGIFSSAGDLYQWHRTLLNGKVLKPDILKKAYQPCILKNDSIVYYGFGWNLDPEDPYHVWHSGELEGFRTWFDRRLDNGQVIILLSNNSSPELETIAGRIWRLWLARKEIIQ